MKSGLNGRYEGTDDVIRWFQDGELHREDGPAKQWPSGTKEWWIHGMRHREDGPAIEHSNGAKAWYLNGRDLTEEQFNHFLEKKALNEKLHASLVPKLPAKRGKI